DDVPVVGDVLALRVECRQNDSLKSLSWETASQWPGDTPSGGNRSADKARAEKGAHPRRRNTAMRFLTTAAGGDPRCLLPETRHLKATDMPSPLGVPHCFLAQILLNHHPEKPRVARTCETVGGLSRTQNE
ncbi:hypothetical protein JZY06_05310, partial [Corynebacterium sp. CCM 8862]